MTSWTQGDREVTNAFNAEGLLASATDAHSRTRRYEYDGVGRITKETLPDGRAVLLSYDANGNVTSIIPPGRPAHLIAYTPVDLESEYAPPPVVIPSATRYSYNRDRQITLVARPDGKRIEYVYDQGGRLSTISFDRGTIGHSYSASTGQVVTIVAPGSEGLSLSYDGFLVLSETYSGSVSGVVSRTFDNDFRVASLGVNGAAISYAYDPDGLVTQAGPLGVTRNAASGFVAQTTLGGVSTTQAIDGFGEVASFTSPVLSLSFTRNRLAQITEKRETISGVTTTFSYAYDVAGRLSEVRRDGAVTASCAYDANGNRLPGVYDDQDRLLSYGANTYTYNAAGDLTSKGATTYTYDAFGNLVTATLPSGTRIDYAIDALNRRIAKRVNGALRWFASRLSCIDSRSCF